MKEDWELGKYRFKRHSLRVLLLIGIVKGSHGFEGCLIE